MCRCHDTTASHAPHGVLGAYCCLDARARTVGILTLSVPLLSVAFEQQLQKVIQCDKMLEEQVEEWAGLCKSGLQHARECGTPSLLITLKDLQTMLYEEPTLKHRVLNSDVVQELLTIALEGIERSEFRAAVNAMQILLHNTEAKELWDSLSSGKAVHLFLVGSLSGCDAMRFQLVVIGSGGRRITRTTLGRRRRVTTLTFYTYLHGCSGK